MFEREEVPTGIRELTSEKNIKLYLKFTANLEKINNI